MGNGQQKDKIQYRRFVEEGLLREIENPLEQVRWQNVLGDESFARRFRDKFKSMREQRREITGVREALRMSESRELIDRVAKHYGMVSQELLQKRTHGSQARNVAMWLLRQQGGLTLRAIGLLFGGIDYASVSDRIRRVNRQIPKQKQLRRTCEILNL